jgi:hypothetical protein
MSPRSVPTMPRQKPNPRPSDLDLTPDLDAAVSALIRAVRHIGRRVDRVARRVELLDRGSQATTALVVRQMAVLTTLLLDRGLIDPDEFLAASEVALLRAMFERPARPMPGRRRGPDARR